MDTLVAFALGRLNSGAESMVFDWGKAATIIVETGARDASAGLSGDWEWTGGPILLDGDPVPEEDTYTYLASTWAKPELRVAGRTFECYRMQSESPGWDAETYWPEEALEILRRHRNETDHRL